MEPNYLNGVLNIVKLGELEHEPISEICIDFTKKTVKYRTLIDEGKRFRKAKDEQLNYFDYGWDSFPIFEMCREFFKDWVSTYDLFEIPVEDIQGKRIIKYIYILLNSPTLQVLNNLYNTEVLLFSDWLEDMTSQELLLFFESDIDNYEKVDLELQFHLSIDILKKFTGNKFTILDNLVFGMRLYNEYCFTQDLISRFFNYLSDYSLDINLISTLKEILLYTHDLNDIVDFLATVEIHSVIQELVYTYIDDYLHYCRKQNTLGEPISATLLLIITRELERKIAQEEKELDERITKDTLKLLEIFGSGKIIDFSLEVLNLTKNMPLDEISFLEDKFKELFTKQLIESVKNYQN